MWRPCAECRMSHKTPWGKPQAICGDRVPSAECLLRGGVPRMLALVRRETTRAVQALLHRQQPVTGCGVDIAGACGVTEGRDVHLGDGDEGLEHLVEGELDVLRQLLVLQLEGALGQSADACHKGGDYSLHEVEADAGAFPARVELVELLAHAHPLRHQLPCLSAGERAEVREVGLHALVIVDDRAELRDAGLLLVLRLRDEVLEQGRDGRGERAVSRRSGGRARAARCGATRCRARRSGRLGLGRSRRSGGRALAARCGATRCRARRSGRLELGRSGRSGRGSDRSGRRGSDRRGSLSLSRSRLGDGSRTHHRCDRSLDLRLGHAQRGHHGHNGQDVRCGLERSGSRGSRSSRRRGSRLGGGLGRGGSSRSSRLGGGRRSGRGGGSSRSRLGGGRRSTTLGGGRHDSGPGRSTTLGGGRGLGLGLGCASSRSTSRDGGGLGGRSTSRATLGGGRGLGCRATLGGRRGLGCGTTRGGRRRGRRGRGRGRGSRGLRRRADPRLVRVIGGHERSRSRSRSLSQHHITPPRDLVLDLSTTLAGGGLGGGVRGGRGGGDRGGGGLGGARGAVQDGDLGGDGHRDGSQGVRRRAHGLVCEADSLQGADERDGERAVLTNQKKSYQFFSKNSIGINKYFKKHYC
jgi:hypothetical protein